MNKYKLSILQWVLLYSVPIVIALIVRALVVPAFISVGIPQFQANFVYIGLVIIFELGYMLFLGKKLTGRFSLKDIILYRERLPIWQYIVFTIVLLVFSFGIIFLMTPISMTLRETVFSWVPASTGFNPSEFSQSGLVIILIVFAILNLSIAVVEELYYRGFLLPRMSGLGFWAPIVSVVLWTITHLGQPWDIPGFIIMFIPLAYIVRWKKNVYLAILGHTLGNLVNIIMIGSMVFG